MSATSSMHASSAGRRRCIRVISADEAPLFRDALARAIRQDSALELVDEAANADELIAAIARQSPDVVLVDAALLDGVTLAAVRSTRVLVMTEAVDAPAAYAAVEAGAAGYLSKDVEGQVICRTVATIARGGTVLDPCVQTGIANDIRLRARDERPLLSAREHEILVLIAAGLTTPAIARQLGVSSATAKTHQQHRYDEWTAILERLARVHGLDGKRLLDVGCGTGKSFIPYLARGYEITACDVSPAMAERAAANAAGRARVLVADMRTLPRLGSFDLVACVDDAVNYLLAHDELVAALTGLRRNLAPGGVVVLDTNTLMAYRSFFALTTVVPSEAQVLVWDGHESPDFESGGVAHATLTALCRGEDGWWTRTEIEHAQRHHPEAAVRDAMRAAGLECAAVYGMHLDGSTDEGFDEVVNSKAVYIARASAQEDERR